MAKWVDVKTFARMIGTGEHNVYKKIRAGKLDTKKDVTGKLLILVDPDQHLDDNLTQELSDPEKLLNFIKEMQNSIVTETQTAMKEIIEKLEQSYKEQIEVKETHLKEIITIKDDEIKRLREELKEVVQKNDKLMNKSFFKRLFGG